MEVKDKIGEPSLKNWEEARKRIDRWASYRANGKRRGVFRTEPPPPVTPWPQEWGAPDEEKPEARKDYDLANWTAINLELARFMEGKPDARDIEALIAYRGDLDLFKVKAPFVTMHVTLISLGEGAKMLAAALIKAFDRQVAKMVMDEEEEKARVRLEEGAA